IIFHVFNLSKFSGKILLNNYMVLAAVIFILFSFYLLILTPANGIDGNGFDRVFFYGGPAFLIFVSFRLIESYLPKSKFLLFLGDASYSIYLTHILVINAVYQLFKFFGFQFDFSILMISLATGFSFIFGCLIHKFIEIPFI
ncbi:acyltransferase family protein, partial [Rosenbergiella collisarenosi]|uniref:acyltransferase family protein n=1 Tax=Rosenbergiella collisarenosi TaxID=1544695 RepID=UPI0030C8645C